MQLTMPQRTPTHVEMQIGQFHLGTGQRQLQPPNPQAIQNRAIDVLDLSIKLLRDDTQQHSRTRLRTRQPQRESHQ